MTDKLNPENREGGARRGKKLSREEIRLEALRGEKQWDDAESVLGSEIETKQTLQNLSSPTRWESLRNLAGSRAAKTILIGPIAGALGAWIYFRRRRAPR